MKNLIHHQSGETFDADADPMLAIVAVARAVGFVRDWMPKEPGLYQVNNGMVLELTDYGRWQSPNGSRDMTEVARRSHTFLRLEPQPNQRPS